MNFHKNVKRYMILAFIILSSGVIINIKNNYEIYTPDQRFFETPGIKSSGSPILIDDADPNYNWSKTANDNDWCSGSGTWTDPYIIENVTIDGQTSESCITVQNSSVNFIIRNCTLFQAGWNQAGIYLNNVNNSILRNNSLSSNSFAGICLWENCVNNTIQDNTWYGDEFYCLYFYKNCDKNRILNNKMEDSGGYGIYFSEDNDDNIIQNNLITGIGDIQAMGTGIWLDDSCDNNIISNNDVSNNIDNGIVLSEFCHDNTISGNILKYNYGGWGICLIQYCNGNTIFNNTVNENANNVFTTGTGIYLVLDCDYNNISQNAVNDNDEYGIYIADGSGNNTLSGNIFGNTITARQNTGIFLENSDDNIIIGNTFLNNNLRGVDIDANSDNTLIYLNYFLNSGVVHARDLGSNNNWNNSKIGNFWDTYVGVDGNQDGIGDTFYNFSTGIDYLPILDDDAPSITIIEPSLNQVCGENAPDFVVEIKDAYLDEMWYSVDSGQNITFYDNGTIDQIEWDGFSDGSYDITFYANDTFDHEASEKVTVIKDMINPLINIISPMTGSTINTTSLSFTVEIFDDHLDKMWYTINSGVTKYFFSTNSTIQGWINFSDGAITIRFYANDTAGNIESEHTTVIKDIPETPNDGNGGGIPAYNMLVVYSTAFLSVIFILLFIRKKKGLKKY